MTDQDTHPGARSIAGRMPFIGRARELEELDAALAAVRAGQGRLVLIAGEPGIGKTRLVEEVAERAVDRGMIALWGRAWETAGAPSYWPWVQALRGLVGTRNGQLEAELGAGAGWLSQILPELRERLPGVEPPRSTEGETARFSLFDSASSFLRAAAADTPLVIVLDDLHAADTASLLLLEFVAHSVDDSPLLLLVTYQEAATSRRPELGKLIGSLARRATTIHLRGMPRSDLERMAAHSLGDSWADPPVGSLHEATEGNPFYATEILRLLATGGEQAGPAKAGAEKFPLPSTVRQTVRLRFDPLAPESVAVLEAAAVIGREFRLATLELVAPARDGLIAAIDQAVDAGLIAEVPGSVGRFRFTHNLIRETLYVDLGTAGRAQLHRAVGEALERRYGALPERLGELAHHFAEAARAGDARKVVEYAAGAGAEAMRTFAYEQAADHYRLALDASEQLEQDPERRATLMLALGKAIARTDDLAGREALLAAADAARELEDPGLFAEAGLAMRAWPHGSGILDEQPGRILDEALVRLGDRDSALRARVMARLAVSLYYWPGTDERRSALVDDAVAIARRLGNPVTLSHVLSNGQYGTWGPDHTERDLEWMEELLALTRETGDQDLEVVARTRQIDLLLELDDVAAFDAAMRDFEHMVPESPDPRARAYAVLQRARQEIIAGRYDEAEQLNRDVAATAEQVRDPNLSIFAATQLAGVRWAQGRTAELEPAIRRTLTTDVTPAWQAALVLACCEAGRDEEARQRFERLAADEFREIPRYSGWLITMAVLAEACVHLRDSERAGMLYALLLPFAGRNVTSFQSVYGGPVARYLGILAGVREQWERAQEHFAAARQAAERIGSPPIQLRVETDETEMLAARRGGDRPGAAPPEHRVGATGRLWREGDTWAFELDQRALRVRDGKGVRCLALLLANPAVEIHALELAGENPGNRAAAAAGELDGPAPDDAGPVLDAQAKAAYRNRLEELREELAEAEAFNDPERAARAREEIELVASELAGAVGLGGRDRKAASTAERARVSVTKAIRSTIRRIGEQDADLGRELDATVRTGTFCVHEPDPRRPIAWQVDAS